MRWRFTLVLAIGLLVVGCNLLLPAGDGPDGDGAGGPLDGEWRLVDGSHVGAPLPIPEDAPITMTITDGEIGGRAACNSYGGPVTIEDDRITIGSLAVTEMGCDRPIMDAESAYLAALGDVTTWRGEGRSLTLQGDGVNLTFENVPPEPDAALTGTRWALESLVDGEVAMSTVGDEPATLELADDGTLTGSTGCRGFGGRWALDGTTLTISDLAVDDRSCPDLATQDEHVLGVLEAGGVNVGIDGSTLTLSADGLGLVYRADEA